MQENRTTGDTKGSAGRVARQDTCRDMDSHSSSSRRRSGEQPESENVEDLEDEEVMDEGSEFCEEEEGTGRPGCRSKYWAQIRGGQRDGFSEIRADQRDGFSESHADQREGFSKIRVGQNDGFSKIRANRWSGARRVEANICDEFGKEDVGHRDGFGKIRADHRDELSKIREYQRDGFSQNLRKKTCKRLRFADLCSKRYRKEVKEVRDVRRRNRFLALTTIESEDDEQVNAVETVQEVVEITVGSGAAKSVRPSRKQGVERTKSTKTVKLAAASGSPIRVEGDARLEFIRDGMKCSMKFLDADVKRPLASVCTIVDDGNVVVFGQHESFIENVSTGQRIPMCRRNGVFVMRLDTQPCQKTSKSVRFNEEGVIERMSGFTRLA